MKRIYYQFMIISFFVILISGCVSNDGSIDPGSNSDNTSANGLVKIPQAPTHPVATAVSTTQINLTWEDNSNNEWGFIVQYSGHHDFSNGVVTLPRTAKNITSMEITDLSPNKWYYFKIKAINAAGKSSETLPASAKTFAPDVQTLWVPPSTPIPTTSAFYPMLAGMNVQTQEAYRVIYHWLAHYTSADFDLSRNPVTYDATYLANDDNAFRFRALLANYGRDLPELRIMQVTSDKFLLSTIDKNGQLMVMASDTYVFVEPIAAAWHYDWNYPGNPNYHSVHMINRSFVYAMAMMVWLDHQHELGNELRSDFAGQSLTRFAIPYALGKDALPPAVKDAYELILKKMFDRLDSMPVNAVFGDMETPAALGMYYVAKALHDPTYYSRAAAHAQLIYVKAMNQAGFEIHESAVDSIYINIANYFMSWLLGATMADPMAKPLYVSWLPGYMDRSCNFSNLITYSDPVVNGPGLNLLSPSHFNTANGGGPGSAIWDLTYKNEFAGGMYAPKCRTRLHYQGFPNTSTIFRPLNVSPNDMRAEIQGALTPSSFVNSTTPLCTGVDAQNRWSVTCVSTDGPTYQAVENHWQTSQSFGFDYTYYKPGYYQDIQGDIASNDPTTKYPSQSGTNFIEKLEDGSEPNAQKKLWFVMAQSPTMNMVSFWGSLAWRNGPNDIAGFGGGALSTVATGGSPIIMGADRGSQDGPLLMSQWRDWPTHQIAGLDSSGHYFGNARDRGINRSMVQNGDQSFTATATGQIGVTANPLTNPGGNINGNMTYTRTISFDQTVGITVHSTLNSNGSDHASELYESIPVYKYHGINNDCTARPQECTVISLKVGTNWVSPTTSWTSNVTAIKLNRFNKPLYVKFSAAKKVKLSPNEIQLVREPQHFQAVLIDLLGNNGSVVSVPSTVDLVYTISTTP